VNYIDDSDDGARMMWGDGGTLYFLMTDEALVERRPPLLDRTSSADSHRGRAHALAFYADVPTLHL
jgi:hypothetical protein